MTTNTNLLDLINELERLSAFATEGPYYIGHMSEIDDKMDVHERGEGRLIAEGVCNADFLFWNASRSAIPTLCQAVRELSALVQWQQNSSGCYCRLSHQVMRSARMRETLQLDTPHDNRCEATRAVLAKWGMAKEGE